MEGGSVYSYKQDFKIDDETYRLFTSDSESDKQKANDNIIGIINEHARSLSGECSFRNFTLVDEPKYESFSEGSDKESTLESLIDASEGGVVGKDIKIGDEIVTKDGNKIKITDMTIQFGLYGKPSIKFDYDYETTDGTKGHSYCYDKNLYDMIIPKGKDESITESFRSKVSESMRSQSDDYDGNVTYTLKLIHKDGTSEIKEFTAKNEDDLRKIIPWGEVYGYTIKGSTVSSIPHEVHLGNHLGNKLLGTYPNLKDAEIALLKYAESNPDDTSYYDIVPVNGDHPINKSEGANIQTYLKLVQSGRIKIESLPDIPTDDLEGEDTFINEGVEYKWDKVESTYTDLGDTEWAVKSAIVVDPFNSGYEKGEVYYFVVDDTDFIDWGPCDTLDEAEEFMYGKDDPEDDDDIFSDIDFDDED